MTKRNDLLEEDIRQNIAKARYMASKEEKSSKSLFYVLILCLVTLAVLLSLFK